MKHIYTFVAIFISSIGISQSLSPIFGDTINTGHEISLSSFNYISSNSFNNQFIDIMAFGGNLDSDIKSFNQSKLGRTNTLGGEFRQKIEYANFDFTPLKKFPNLGVVFSIEDVNFLSSNLNSDLFNIIFEGNANYVGDTADFSFSHVQYQHYQKISLGVITKDTKSSLKLSYVSGNRSIDYRVGDSWMYTSALSDSIVFNLNAEGHYTDSISSYLNSKGAGFSIDLSHNFIYLSKNNKQQIINFSLGNLGAIFWNNKTTYNYVDSISTWSGFDVVDLMKKDSTTNYNFVDTLGIYDVKRSKTELLPFELSIQKLANRYSDQKVQLIFGFKSIITSDYKPYLFAGAYYSPNQKIGVSSRLAYGGFGGFKVGLNANYWVQNKFNILIGTYDLVGFISPKYGFGRSLHLSASIKF